MNNIYKNPVYYEIAFSFRDIPGETDLFLQSIEKFSQIPVRRFFEIACGNSPHMEEIIKRGYEYVGIDLSGEMLDYSSSKASRKGGKAEFFQADLASFSLAEMVDYAFIALGSLYIKDTSEIISHFDSVGKALKRGGLYLLDWCIEFGPPCNKTQSWEMERDGIRIKTDYSLKQVNFAEQTYDETIVLNIDENGKKFALVETSRRRIIYPQEFLLFISHRQDFEFIGWWNNWDLAKPLTGNEAISRPIVILRKK